MKIECHEHNDYFERFFSKLFNFELKHYCDYKIKK